MGVKMTNKTNEVLNHLKTKKNLTSWEAIHKYGATRLSAIIFRLRKKGYRIINRNEVDIDRYGNECRYVRYIYLGKIEEEPQVDEVVKKWFEHWLTHPWKG